MHLIVTFLILVSSKRIFKRVQMMARRINSEACV